eukprot:TRINITY_DN66181_c5_g4_i4.p1 TRINITY_DN66181_c5_g4~~TRINITY_DN66181_c5_g4_i4.p1  ORF type:complete len:141 (+),score=11.18 TRINITY_DN66181_c5_g4_i4:770-1192(+)
MLLVVAMAKFRYSPLWLLFHSDRLSPSTRNLHWLTGFSAWHSSAKPFLPHQSSVVWSSGRTTRNKSCLVLLDRRGAVLDTEKRRSVAPMSWSMGQRNLTVCAPLCSAPVGYWQVDGRSSPPHTEKNTTFGALRSVASAKS